MRINGFEINISRKYINNNQIKIFYKLEFKIDNNNYYFYQPIKKEFIINNSNSNYLSSQKIENKLNYNDKYYRILIKKIEEDYKIEFNIELKDDKNNHCYFPIGLYEKKSKKLIRNNFIIFSIAVLD